MTGPKPPAQPKKLLRASLSIAALMLVAFTSNAGGLWAIPLVLLGIAAMFGYVFPLATYRPQGEKWVFVPAMLIFFATGFLANAGGHSLWLSVVGETVHCRVDDVERHSSTRGSASFSNTLVCGDKKLKYSPTNFRSAKPINTETNFVIDKTGFVGILEPDQVSWKYNLIFLAGLLMNAAFMLLVARLPNRQQVPAAEERQR